MKFKSVAIVIVLLSVYAAFSGFYLSTIIKNTNTQTYTYLSEITKLSAKSVNTKIDGDIALIKSISVYIGNQEDFEIDSVLTVLKNESKLNSFKRMGVILPDGTVSTTDNKTNDFSNREYFGLSMKGRTVISEPLIDMLDGEKINVYSTPIYHKGEIVGVLFATHDTEIYSDLLAVSTFGGEGYSYIIEKNGDTIVDSKHRNGMENFPNLFDIFENDMTTETIISDMQNGKSGHIIINSNGTRKHMNYEPIGVNDWYITSIVPYSAASYNANLTVTASLVMSATAVAVFMLLLMYILSEQKKSKKSLERFAYVDSLTGCPNWNKFLLDCKKILESYANEKFAMVVFDVDKFKVINELYGTKQGNETLKFIAKGLSKNMKEHEIYARTSADNFCFMLKYDTDEDIIKRINIINNGISRCYDDYKLYLSFGIYKITDKLLDIGFISDRANIAKKTIKSKTDTSYAFYTDEIRDKILEEKEIENNMEISLEKKEFKMYLQPKYSLSTGKIVGAEALVRWEHSVRGIIYPDTFIPLFEKNGFIRKLDYFMIEQVCKLLQQYKFEDMELLPISVNLSRVHLGSSKILDDIAFIARSYYIPHEFLEIELTESAFFDSNEKLIEVMNGLKESGFKISIDDFGSGYSSLNMLKDLPVDVLKIDKVFLEQATDTERGKKIITSILRMAKDLELCTVAEGVETMEQAEYLNENGCDIAQGYYYAKPMTKEEFTIMIKNQNTLNL